jgi:hypothetical protein
MPRSCAGRDFAHGGLNVPPHKSAGKRETSVTASYHLVQTGRCAHPTWVISTKDGSVLRNTLASKHRWDRIAATDPASASSGRPITSFAISCACRCANSVPTKSWKFWWKRGRESRRPSCCCPTEFPDKPFGSSTHLAHKMQSKGESARRSGRNVIDPRKSVLTTSHLYRNQVQQNQIRMNPLRRAEYIS